MSQRLLFATIGLALLCGAACTTWQDETKGTDTSVAQGGAGSCMGCYEYLQAVDTCVDPDCPSPDDVCAGPARGALDAFLTCACGACAAECADLCSDAGAGGSGTSDACESCSTGACMTEGLACAGS